MSGQTWNPSLGEEASSQARALATYSPERVLDLGCGDGRNLAAFPAASLRLGVDVDRAALIAARRRFGTKLGSPIFAQMRAEELSLTKQFELVMCHGVLHFLSASARSAALAHIVDATTAGGRVSIVSFNSSVPIPDDLRPLMPEPARTGDELLKTFRNWQIEEWRSYVYEDSHQGGIIQHTHAIDRLVARKD